MLASHWRVTPLEVPPTTRSPSGLNATSVTNGVDVLDVGRDGTVGPRVVDVQEVVGRRDRESSTVGTPRERDRLAVVVRDRCADIATRFGIDEAYEPDAGTDADSRSPWLRSTAMASTRPSGLKATEYTHASPTSMLGPAAPVSRRHIRTVGPVPPAAMRGPVGSDATVSASPLEPEGANDPAGRSVAVRDGSVGSGREQLPVGRVRGLGDEPRLARERNGDAAMPVERPERAGAVEPRGGEHRPVRAEAHVVDRRRVRRERLAQGVAEARSNSCVRPSERATATRSASAENSMLVATSSESVEHRRQRPDAR